MSTVYFALVETADGTGTAKPIWTTRDPELLRLVWRHLRKRLDPVAHKNPAPRTRKSTDGTRFTAGAKGLPEIESSAKFRSDRDATGVARKALRSMAYENQDSGWSKFRCHARLPGQLKAFCGARIENSPNTKHAYSEPCGKCERIVESIPDPDEAENDIKKHFRYVSFNSERNPEVNSKGENHA